MSFYVIIIAVVYVIIVIYLANKGRVYIIYKLPALLVCLEIANVYLNNVGADTGFNALNFILLSYVVILNTNLRGNIKYYLYVLNLVVLLIILSLNISSDIAIFNSISRIGNFILALFIIPLVYSRAGSLEVPKLMKEIMLAVYIYTIYIMISSLIGYGPNHYDTGLVYGFMFEQWYFGAMIIAISPAIVTLKKYTKYKYKIFDILILIILFLMVMLVLRRTVWVIILLGFIIFILLSGLKKKNIKFAVVLLIILIPLLFFFTETSLYGIRSESFLIDNTEDLESEGRYIEIIGTYYTLKDSNNLILGMNYAFDEAGRYGHPNVDRSIHGTYTRILFSSGLFGLFLYFSFLIRIVIELIAVRLYENNIFVNAILSMFILYIGVALTGASGIGLGSSYVVTLFILVGLIIGKKNKSK